VNEGVEDPQGVINRAGKKASHMVEDITVYQARIYRNFCFIKQYLTEGRRSNLDFKRQIKVIANEL
jgi:hypothetical protein